MDKSALAVDLLEGGRQCAESVLGAYALEYGLNEADAFRVAAGFGGGLCVGSVCGSLAGAGMALGLALGGSKAPEDRVRMAGAMKELAGRFSKRWGSVDCVAILRGMDIDPADSETPARLRLEGLCVPVVEHAARLVAEIMEEFGAGGS